MSVAFQMPRCGAVSVSHDPDGRLLAAISLNNVLSDKHDSTVCCASCVMERDCRVLLGVTLHHIDWCIVINPSKE